MTLQWADFPSGQEGLYGLVSANMLNGTPWVALPGVSAPLLADPDPVNFPDGIVFEHDGGSTGAGDGRRIAIPNPHQRVGVAHRLWIPSLPVDTRPFIFFNSTTNVPRYGVRVQPNGGMDIIRWVNSLPGTGVVETVADYPILFANSWNHIETILDVVTGDIEVRVNGTPVPELDFLLPAPPGGTIGMVAFIDRNPGDAGSQVVFYSKDVVVYNGAGTEFNDFQGTVAVIDTIPDGDADLGGWLLTSGMTAYTLIDEAPADDAGYIYSGLAPTDPLSVTLTDLPPDITSVRGIIMIGRGFNSDSGDGGVQMSVSPDAGVSVDSGAAHVMTTTPTYYYDASELSPATGVSWTPTEINNLILEFNRSL